MLQNDAKSTTMSTDPAEGGAEPILTTDVEAIASLDDNDPADVPLLYPSIDTEALNQLFRSAANGEGGSLRLEFTHEEYHITIENASSTTVTVTRQRQI